MNKTKIEWCDYTINPVKGKCPMGCSYCYARRMYDRFKWNPVVRYRPHAMDVLASIPDGSKVFWGSTIELFHDNIPAYWLKHIFTVAWLHDNLTHIFLTKQPHNLIKWSPFPNNCWVGVSVAANGDMTNAYYGLEPIKAGKRFVSFEPLLGQIGMDDHVNIKEYLDWVIIGQQTPVKKFTMPRLEWIKEIVAAADRARIPVFLKDNLFPFFDSDPDFGIVCRQEWPR